MDKVEYMSLKQLVDSKQFPFSMGQLRHYLIHRHKNGLQNAVRRLGKRLYIRLDHFEQWVEEQKEGKNG